MMPSEWLVRRWHPELFYLILEGQLASLQFYQLEIVEGRTRQCFVDFTFNVAVFTLQLCKMGCKRHDRLSLHGSS